MGSKERFILSTSLMTCVLYILHTVNSLLPTPKNLLTKELLEQRQYMLKQRWDNDPHLLQHCERKLPSWYIIFVPELTETIFLNVSMTDRYTDIVRIFLHLVPAQGFFISNQMHWQLFLFWKGGNYEICLRFVNSA